MNTHDLTTHRCTNAQPEAPPSVAACRARCRGPVPDELERLNLSVNVFFLADIIMNFNTGYIDHVRQLLVMNRPRIAMNYLTGWFFVDFISSLPWEYLDTGESVQTVRALKINKVTRAFRVMRSLKLVRAVKIVNTIKNWSRLGILPLYQVDPKTPTAVHRLFGERMGRRYELARDTCMLPIQAPHVFACLSLSLSFGVCLFLRLCLCLLALSVSLFDSVCLSEVTRP